MLLLTSTSDVIRVTTSTATTTIEVHASFVDASGSTITPGRSNTRITTAATTTIVAAPGASTQRNVKTITVSNTSAGTTCTASLEHFDGTNAARLASVALLPGESLALLESGAIIHRDRAGAEYPPAGLGAFDGRTVPFQKAGTVADAVGYWYCTSKDAGQPGAWSPGTPGINGRVTNGTTAADAGSILIPNAAVGKNYITDLSLSSSVNHSHLFFDVLWVNTGIAVTTTTAQAITTPTLPARDADGLTNGECCTIGLLTTTANTNAAAISNSTVSYTNSKGVAGRVASLVAVAGANIPATPVIGTMVWFRLAAGDTGVSSIQSITLGTSLGAGAVSLMIARPILTIGTTLPNVAASKVPGPPGIKIYNGTCMLHSYIAGATTASFVSGQFSIMER